MAAQHILNTAHTVGCDVELALALTAAIILADAAVTPTVSEMTYNVSSGTLNHTQPTICPLALELHFGSMPPLTISISTDVNMIL